MSSLLEYREFPIKKAVSFIALAPYFAFSIFVIGRIINGTLSTALSHEQHLGLLGIGFLAALFSLIVMAVVLGRMKKPYFVTLFFGLIVPVIFLLGEFTSLPPETYLLYVEISVITLFVGLIFTLAATTVQLNETVVIRYRGRITGGIASVMLLLMFGYRYVESIGVGLPSFGASIVGILALTGVIISAILKPWKWDRHPLSVAEEPKRYFVPTFFLLAAYLLWYFSTQQNIVGIFAIVGEEFTSLGEYSGLTVFEPLMLAAGGILAALIADLRGRKVGFNSLVLLIGLLAIFGTTFYGIERKEIAPGIFDTVAYLNAAPLLIAERVVEGFMLTLLVMLIWSEIGSPKTRSKRIAAVWIFFLGYIALFLGVKLGALGLGVPEAVSTYGREFAILLSLIASYLTSHVPEVLDREVELEELELNFDEELIEDTVEAFVGSDDFESIRSQLELVDGTIETPEGTIDIMSEDFNKILPLRTIPGIGEVTEQRLKKAGYKSAAQIAGETPKRLASKVPGLTEEKAQKILRATRKKVKEVLERFSW